MAGCRSAAARFFSRVRGVRRPADPEPIDGLGAMTWSEGPVAPELAMGLRPAAVPGLG